MASAGVRDLELDLDAFEGPFDLLLTLVLREELALSDVAVAEIVVTFVERLLREGHDPEAPLGPLLTREQIELCGEFLVLVSSLLELKARELFEEDGELELEELDPDEAAAELAERLAEYRRIRAGAAWLEERLAGGGRFFRVGPAPLAPAPERKLAPQDAERLAAAIRALAQEPPVPSLAHLALKLPPLERFLERFRSLVRARRRFLFDEEVDGLSRVEIAVAFLALLELRKEGEVELSQPEPFAPIAVAPPAAGGSRAARAG
jgi:segregation and condensation protein A